MKVQKSVLRAKILTATANLSREAWLEFRRKGIGGSDAAGIMGLSPYNSAYSVWADKMGLLEDKKDNEAMRQGRDLEGYVASRFIEDCRTQGLGIKKVKECRFMLSHPQYPFMTANVDRLVVGEKAGLECKTTSVLNLKRFKNGEFPTEYYTQCVHYMAVTGAERWYLEVLILNSGTKLFVIERDETEINALISAEKDFWDSCVVKGVAPPTDGTEATKRALREMFPDGIEDLEMDLFGYNEELKKIIQISAKIKSLEIEKEKYVQLVQAYMGEAGIGTATDFTVSFKSYVQNRVDAEKLKTQFPDIYNSVIKRNSQRRFIVKEIESKN